MNSFLAAVARRAVDACTQTGAAAEGAANGPPPVFFSSAAAAEGEALMRSHLELFMQRNGRDATFEGWIAQLHPENVTLDRRLRLKESRHAALWEQWQVSGVSDGEVDERVLVTELQAGGASSLWLCGPRQLAPSAAASAPAGGARVVRLCVEPGRPRQRMLGWGGTMTESSAAVIMGSPRRDAILDDLFLPPERGGAGISCVRVCIASSDFALDPPGATSYRDSERAPFDASRAAVLLVPCLQAARRRNSRLVLLGSPWSAPAWMKTSNSLVGGSLRRDMVPAYCRYLLQALLFWRSHGLPLHALTLQNEPFHDGAAYPCMQVDEEMQALLAADLSRLLRSNGLATRILVHDHNYSLASRASDTLRKAEARLRGCVDGSAWHAYDGSPGVLATEEEVARIPIYVTEQTAHTERPRGACSVAHAHVGWSLRNVTLGPVLLGAVCGCQWNLALDEALGPVLSGGPTNCRALVEVPSSGAQHERAPEWYALAHAAHAATAGCWRVATRGDAATHDDEVLVAVFTSGEGYGVLAHNGTGAPVALELSFEGAGGVRTLQLPPHSLLSAARLAPPAGTVFTPAPPDAPRRPPRELRLPPALFLRSVAQRTYLAAHGEDASLVYQSEPQEPGAWEVWRPVEASDRSWRLRSFHGTLLGLGRDRTPIQLHGANLLAALEFTIFFFDDGTVGLCADAGNLQMPARRLLDGGWELPRLRQGPFGAWEAFEAIPACLV